MAIPNKRPITTMQLEDNTPDNIYDFPLDGAIREVGCICELDLKNGANAPVFKEDDILNYFKDIAVRRNGKDLKFTLPLRFAYKKQTAEIGTPAYYKRPGTTPNEEYTAIVAYKIHFAENISNKNDITALLQTGELTNCELVVSTGNKDDIASQNPPEIIKARIKLAVRDFTGKGLKGGNINKPSEEKMTDITEKLSVIDLEPNKTNYKNPQDIDMEAKTNILEHALFVLDDGLASNTLVTDIRTWRSKLRVFDMEATFEDLFYQTKTDYALESLIDGLVLLDWQEWYGRGGYQTNAKSDELLQLLTNSDVTKGTDEVWVYTKSV